MTETKPVYSFDSKKLAVLVLFLAPFLLFACLKVVLNTDAFGTDTVKPMPKNQLKHVGSKLAYAPPFKVFGDLTDGMFPAAKVYEDDSRLGVSVDWHGDLFQQGNGRIFHQENLVAFSTSDNSHPLTNGREYSVGYNPMAWLNVDWLSLVLLVAVWLSLGFVKGSDTARILRKSPAPWLGLFLFDRFATILSSPNFALSLVPDSGSYTSIAAKLASLEAVLSAFRTIGYPLFYAVTPEALIPAVQLGIFFCAVFIIFLGLRSISGHGWVDLLACLPMATLNNIYRLDPIAYSHLLIPDVMALSMGMIAVGTCLLALGSERNRWLWLGACAVATMCAYLLKPSYLFLVACIPGIALGWIVLCRLYEWKNQLQKAFLPLCIAVLIPLLLFCSLRLAMVDHFGLVSAGGRQLIGLAGNFLDSKTAGMVSEDMRPFANDVAEIMKTKKALAPRSLEGEGLYKHIFRTYDWIIYGNGELIKYCPGTLECDAKLGALSREVLTLHLDRYISWLAASASDALKRAFMLGRWEAVVLGGLGLSLVFFLAALLRAKEVVPLKEGLTGYLLSCDMKMVLWSFICLLVSSLLVIILVAIPYSRYLLPTKILFLPLCLYLIGVMVSGGVKLWQLVPGKA